MKKTFFPKTSTRLLSAAIASCFASVAYGLPVAPTVVNGTANFSQSGNVLTVTNSNGAIINWNTFSIGAGETTRFIQSSSSSQVLNRVLSNNPSLIYGTLSSNGRVWLVNPAGILVGAGGVVDTAGFVASTLPVRNQDFLAGKLTFGSSATTGSGSVVNQGTITTAEGGSVYLVGAASVENRGLIQTPKGETVLAAGQTVQLIDTGSPGVKVEITGNGSSTNLGQIVADAGRIGLVGSLVKNSGTLNASSVVNEGGRIFLRASQDAYVDGDGRIVTTGTKGGQVEVLGNRVAVMDNASIDASGTTGGGTVLVGGDYQGKNPGIPNSQVTYFGPNASIKANASDKGDGGKVIVWADDTTRGYGRIEAKGGANGGNGGFVETSGHKYLSFNAKVDTSASHGHVGTLLLDPEDIYVINAQYGGTDDLGGGAFSLLSAVNTLASGSGTATIYGSNLQALLDSNDVVLTTSRASDGSGTGNGNISFSGVSITSTSGHSLTLKATGYARDGFSPTGNVSFSNSSLNLGGALDIYSGWSESGTSVTAGKGAITTDASSSLSASSMTWIAGKSIASYGGLTATGSGGMGLTAYSGDITVGGTVALTGSSASFTARAGGSLRILSDISTYGGAVTVVANDNTGGTPSGTGIISMSGGSIGTSGGAVTMTAASIDAEETINTASSGGAGSGSISLTATRGSISVAGSLSTAMTDSDAESIGATGSITLTAAQSVTVSGALSTRSENAVNGSNSPASRTSHDTGAITVTAKNGAISLGEVSTDIAGGWHPATFGNAGAVTLSAGTTVSTGNINTGVLANDTASSESGNSVSVGHGGNVGITAGGNIVTGNITTDSKMGLNYQGGDTNSSLGAGNVTLVSRTGNILTGDISMSSGVSSGGGTDGANGTLGIYAYGGDIVVGAISAVSPTSGINSQNEESTVASFSGQTATGGNVTLSALGAVRASAIDVSSRDGNGGAVKISGANVTLTSAIDASSSSSTSGRGGSVFIAANNGDVLGLGIDASGAQGGGVTVRASRNIALGAINTSGSSTDGGKVALYALNGTLTPGAITATAGSGQGGSATLYSANDLAAVIVDTHSTSGHGGDIALLAKSLNNSNSLTYGGASGAGTLSRYQMGSTSSPLGDVTVNGDRFIWSTGNVAISNDITLSSGNLIVNANSANSSANGAGGVSLAAGKTVAVNNGWLAMSGSSLSGNSSYHTYLNHNATVSAAGDLLLLAKGSQVSSLYLGGNVAHTSGGRAGLYGYAKGNIELSAANIAGSSGNALDVTLAAIAGDITSSGASSSVVTQGGNVTMTGGSVTLSSINTGLLLASTDSGAISLTANSGSIAVSGDLSTAIDLIDVNGGGLSTGCTGGITLTAHDSVSVLGALKTSIQTNGWSFKTTGNSGAVNVSARYGAIDLASVDTSIQTYQVPVVSGNAGSITLSAATSVATGALKTDVYNNDRGSAKIGRGGDVQITAGTDISTSSISTRSTAGYSNVGDGNSTGGAGDIRLVSRRGNISVNAVDMSSGVVADGGSDGPNGSLTAYAYGGSIAIASINAASPTAGGYTGVTAVGGNVTLSAREEVDVGSIDVSSRDVNGGTVTISGGSVVLNGDISAGSGSTGKGGTVSLFANNGDIVGQAVTAYGGTGGSITARASGAISLAGGLDVSGSDGAGGKVALYALGSGLSSGNIVASGFNGNGGTVTLYSADDYNKVNVDARSTWGYGGSIAVVAKSISDPNAATLNVSGNGVSRSGTVSQYTMGTDFDTPNDVTLNGDRFIWSKGDIQIDGALSAEANLIVNADSDREGSGGVKITSSGYGGGSLSAASGWIALTGSAYGGTGYQIEVESGRSISAGGDILLLGNGAGNANGIKMAGAISHESVGAAGLYITARGDLDLNGGTINGASDASLTVSLRTPVGRILSGDPASIRTYGGSISLLSQGDIVASGLSLVASTFDGTDAGQVSVRAADGNIALAGIEAVGGDTVSQGVTAGRGGDISVTVGGAPTVNTGATVATTSAHSITLGDVFAVGGDGSGSAGGRGGNVLVSTAYASQGGAVQVGAVSTQGGTGSWDEASTHLDTAGGDGGAIALRAANANLTLTGSLGASGGNAGFGYVSGSRGGTGGTISLIAGGNITMGGDSSIQSVGGSGGTGNQLGGGAGGAGGNVVATAGGNSVQLGNISTNGGDGGDTFDLGAYHAGAGGAGGSVTLTANNGGTFSGTGDTLNINTRRGSNGRSDIDNESGFSIDSDEDVGASPSSGAVTLSAGSNNALTLASNEFIQGGAITFQGNVATNGHALYLHGDSISGSSINTSAGDGEYGGAIILSASSFALHDVTTSSADVTLISPTDLDVAFPITATAGTVTFSVAGALSQSYAGTGITAQNLSIGAGDASRPTSVGASDQHLKTAIGSSLDIRSSGDIYVDNTGNLENTNVISRFGDGAIGGRVFLSNAGNLALGTGNIKSLFDLTVIATGSLTVPENQQIVGADVVNGGTQMNVRAAGITVGAGGVISGGSNGTQAQVDATTGNLDNAGSISGAVGNLKVQGTTIVNRSSGSISVGDSQGLEIISSGLLTNSGSVSSALGIGVSAVGITNNGGSFSAGTGVNLNAQTGKLSNINGGSVYGGTGVALTADAFDLTTNSSASSNSVSTNRGTISLATYSSGVNLSLDTASLGTLSGYSALSVSTVGGAISLGDINAQGTSAFHNGASVTVTAGNGSITASNIRTYGYDGSLGQNGGAGGNVSLTAGNGSIAITGTVDTHGGNGGTGGEASNVEGIGGTGGAGGNGGSFTATATNGAVTVTGQITTYGGRGGVGGIGASGLPNPTSDGIGGQGGHGGLGGAGGNGGAVQISSSGSGAGLLVYGSVLAYGGAGGQGGSGGMGGTGGDSESIPGTGGQGGTGGSGGQGGAGATVTLTTAGNAALASLDLRGGAGGAAGSAGAAGGGTTSGSAGQAGTAGAGNVAGGFELDATGGGTHVFTLGTVNAISAAGDNGSVRLHADDGDLVLAGFGGGNIQLSAGDTQIQSGGTLTLNSPLSHSGTSASNLLALTAGGTITFNGELAVADSAINVSVSSGGSIYGGASVWPHISAGHIELTAADSIGDATTALRVQEGLPSTVLFTNTGSGDVRLQGVGEVHFGSAAGNVYLTGNGTAGDLHVSGNVSSAHGLVNIDNGVGTLALDYGGSIAAGSGQSITLVARQLSLAGNTSVANGSVIYVTDKFTSSGTTTAASASIVARTPGRGIVLDAYGGAAKFVSDGGLTLLASDLSGFHVSELVIGHASIGGSIAVQDGSGASSAFNLSSAAGIGKLSLQAGPGSAVSLNTGLTLASGSDFKASASGSGGNVTLSSALSANHVVVDASGVVTLGANAGITAAASGDAIVLSGNSFANNADANVFHLGASSGRWLVWSADPDHDKVGGLANDFRQYNNTYANYVANGSAALASATGNGLLYSRAPVLTVSVTSATGTSKTYDGFASVSSSFAPNLSISGLLTDDASATSTWTYTAAYNDTHVQTANTISLSGLAVALTNRNGAERIYGYQLSTTNASTAGSIIPRELTATAVIGGSTSKTYNGDVMATGASIVGNISGGIGGDVLSFDGRGLTLTYNSSHVREANSISANGTSGFTIDSSTAGSQATDYSFTAPNISRVSGSITPRVLTMTASIAGTTSKTYDGSAVATGASVVGNVSGGISGDVLSFDGSGLTLAYNSSHVSQANSINASGTPGFAITNSTAGSQTTDYTFTAPTLSVSASITPLPTLDWTGGGTDFRWSNAANWGALSWISGDVSSVSIPSNATVIYDSGAGATSLSSITSLGSFRMDGGTLSVSSSFSLPNYTQTGGTLVGGSAISLSNSGAMSLGNISAGGNIAVTAGGPVTQLGGTGLSGPFLSVQSVGGATLTGDNHLSAFTALNSGSGNVALTNTGVLDVQGITNAGGNVTVDDTGDLSTSGLISAGGTVDITTHSPLTIGSAGVTAGGAIALTAGDTSHRTTTDNLTLNGALTTRGAAVTLYAGNSFTMGRSSSVSSSGGTINATSFGDMVLARLDAGDAGTINLDVHGNASSASGYSGYNLVGATLKGTITGNANLSAFGKRLDMDIGGVGTISFTGPVVAAPVSEAVNSVAAAAAKGASSTSEQKSFTVVLTTVSTGASSSSSTLGNQTVGGTAGTFGSESSSSSSNGSGGGSSSSSSSNSSSSSSSSSSGSSSSSSDSDSKDSKDSSSSSSSSQSSKSGGSKKAAVCS